MAIGARLAGAAEARARDLEERDRMISALRAELRVSRQQMATLERQVDGMAAQIEELRNRVAPGTVPQSAD